MRSPRLPRGPLAIAALALVTLASAGAALAARPAGNPAGDAVANRAANASPVAANPQKLTANTDAGCNAAPRKGFARCFSVVRTPSPGTIVPLASGPPESALGPADIRSAYQLPGSGGGQTVAIVDAFGDSQAEADLAVFRSQYGLPPCTTANGCFRKVDQTGGTSYPPDNAGWGVETSLDLDGVSAACPACNILLVEGTDSSFQSLGVAVDTAVSLGAKFVSNSYGASPEDASQLPFDEHYNHQGVVVTASTGDRGNVTNWPSTNPNVVAVGGTKLVKDSSARGWRESAWSEGGSGCSPVEPHPDYQDGIATNCPNNRATADISADADPASGLATYDTLGQGGWLQVGGTSLASPLVAAMYALAGTPQPGTYPVTYPYHDAARSADLFDITEGTNGACGTILCTAGPGWDGPTGLGTPNGVAALRSGPHGAVTGTVTGGATGTPVAGAVVSASPGGYATRTGTDGTYHLDVQAGTYDLAVAKYGYQNASQSGVTVAADQAITRDFSLTPAPSATLFGSVTDSGHGWPLHAAVAISGYPDGAVYTDPVTGAYRVTLPRGVYTLTVATDYPGYQPVTRQVTIGTSDLRENVALDADLTACTAPGYDWNGSTASFTGGLPSGWTQSGTRSGWRFDNPGNRPAPKQPPTFLTGGDDAFAVADSGVSGDRIDTTLTSPAISLVGQAAPEVHFDSAYYAASGQGASVEVSVDGRRWTTVWRQSTANAIGPVDVPVPFAAGKPRVRVRFHYVGHGGWYWALDNAFLGTPDCTARAGGLLVGVVTDKAAGQPIDGAQVTGTGTASAWPAGVAQGTADPALPGGFYWLFSPSGRQQLTVTAAGYATATATVDVAANAITRDDLALTH